MRLKSIFCLPLFIFVLNVFSQEVSKGDFKKPNILFLLADDLGYAELGSYGQQMIQTPVLDDLAANGMRFTNFYAGSAVCAPSRAVLLTGKSISYSTVRGNKGIYAQNQWKRVPLNKDELSLGELLQKACYQTGFIGKWHLGVPEDVNTWAYNRGFAFAIQEQWGTGKYGRTFTKNMEYINGIKDSIYYKIDNYNSKDEFRTDLALEYLERIDTNKPFFLFMSFRAPHAHEYQIGNKELYSNKDWPEEERKHAAKITLLDKQIGRLLEKLDDLGKLDNTLIIFTSDNGPHNVKHNYEFFDSNGNLKGFKRDLYEGGIRVPFIAYWKGKIKAGAVSDHVGSFQDIMPTLAQVARIEIPEQTNGISILPELIGKSQPEHDYLNFEIQLIKNKNRSKSDIFRQSVRIGDLKAVRYGIHSEIEIFDLKKDISETYDIASEHPKIVEKAEKIFREDRSENKYFPYGGLEKE
ncbi:sulfatase-like hydrolase/transferase [Christiangramia crocea]|uniref:Sulfatase-like hydrolase/transferase n=1 Tax=Christiangramia crocea TaxID=2904124 RepID=A0A9X2A6Q8_9FLAO|nr:sulfatase-like hydrolase/transferase [Gramella crocea]MCG9972554.1 sulfatase-like hydrolase/transferase [Gramella crocea]